MRKLVIKIVANVAAFYCAVQIFTAIHMDSPETGLWAGLILAGVNLFIRPLLFLITLPVNFLTLGLFTLIVNTWTVMLTDAFLGSLRIPGFWLAFATALIVSVVNMLGQSFYPERS
jgi:putative membrane protein